MHIDFFFCFCSQLSEVACSSGIRMSVHNVASRSSEKLLFFGFLVLVRSVLCHGFAEEFNSGSYDFGSVVLEPLDGLRRYVESIVGTHVIEICVEVKRLFLFVS